MASKTMMSGEAAFHSHLPVTHPPMLCKTTTYSGFPICNRRLPIYSICSRMYYFTPTGKRLRSQSDVERFLAENSQNENAVSLSNFSFKRPKPLNKNYVRRHSRPCSSAADARPVSGIIPQMINVNDGEDIVHAIMSIPEQGSRVISILSANGCVSQFTLHHPRFPGGTRTYEGPFEIITLTGTHVPVYRDGLKAISGGFTATFATSAGPVVGGLVSHLFAAGPVQVVVASSPVPAVKKPKNQMPKCRVHLGLMWNRS